MFIYFVLAFFIYGVIFAPIPIFLFLIYRFIFKTKIRPFAFSLLSGLFVYITLLVTVWIVEIKLQAKLDAFDLNGDSFFSGEELSSEQNQAMMGVISDTGRTYAPYTGAVFSFAYFLFLYFFFMLQQRLKRIDEK